MRLRLTKSERLRKQVAEAVLADKAATPADKMAAVRSLERLETAARRRLPALPVPPPEPEPAEPSIDDLVTELERRAIPAKPVEIADSAVLEVPPTNTSAAENRGLKSPPTEGTENRPPQVIDSEGRSEGQNETKNVPAPTRPTELPFQPIRPDEALQLLARAAWQAQTGSAVPPADGLSDFQRSQRIWAQQAQDEADERARLSRELEYERRRNSF